MDEGFACIVGEAGEDGCGVGGFELAGDGFE